MWRPAWKLNPKNKTDMEDQKIPQGQPQAATSAVLGVSRPSLERAMSALEHQISGVKECPQLNDEGLIGKLMREGLGGAEKALEEIEAVLFA